MSERIDSVTRDQLEAHCRQLFDNLMTAGAMGAPRQYYANLLRHLRLALDESKQTMMNQYERQTRGGMR